MGYMVEAAITPKAAAKLLITGEIDLSANWALNSAKRVLDELLLISIDDFLSIVDCNNYGDIADIKQIPQFGRIETVMCVPSFFVQKGEICADYPQLGFFLKKDINASLLAKTKFGENHGKAASILGIARCVDRRICPSALSRAFCSFSTEQQRELIVRLFFRIPIIQILLKASTQSQINGYAPMTQLKESTMRRRSQCLRAIFRTLEEYQNQNLNARIANIVWEDS